MSTGEGNKDHVTPVLAHIHWSQFKVMLMRFKTLYGLGPTYLRDTNTFMSLLDYYGHLLGEIMRERIEKSRSNVK